MQLRQNRSRFSRMLPPPSAVSAKFVFHTTRQLEQQSWHAKRQTENSTTKRVSQAYSKYSVHAPVRTWLHS